MNLLTLRSAKLDKTNKAKPVLSAALNLQPGSFCPWASPGCRAACLQFCGRNRFTEAGRAREAKSQWFLLDRKGFLGQLHKELTLLEGRAKRKGLIPSVRLNNLSDIPWELVDSSLFENHPAIHFHDYTKSIGRYSAWCNMADNVSAFAWPRNYHLTLSRSETNDRQCALLSGVSTAVSISVVFAGPYLPRTYWGLDVVNGDLHDYRPSDPARCIVGLLAKGPAKQDQTGFVVRFDGAGIQTTSRVWA